MRNRLLLVSTCLLGFGCSSAMRTNNAGGSGGEEDTGGKSGGDTGGKSGGSTGGKSGSTGGTSGGDTGGSTGSTGGSTGSTGGSSGSTGGSTGSTGGSTGSTGGSTGSTGGSTGSTGGSSGSTGGGCAGSGAKLCDDFDMQTAGAEPKGMYSIEKSSAGMLTVDNMKAFSGTQSLHIHLNNPPGDSKAQLAFMAPLLPFANNDVHGRAMVWLVKNPGAHWDFATAFGTDKPADDDTKIQYTVGSMAGHMMAVYQPGDDSVDSTTPFPVGKWACLQWEFKHGADGHLLKMMVDGKVVDKGEVTKNNWPGTTWKSMKVGFVTWGSVNMAVDMWLDDLAISDAAIPCPPPK
jgi:hypothetical protein